MQLIFSHHLSLTSCWAFLLPQHVGNGICRHICILFLTCNFDTREDARTYMTFFFFTEFESAWNFTLAQRAFLFVAWSLWGFLSLAVSLFCLRMGCRRRRSSFFASDLCHCFLVLVCHDWNYMGLLWNIVHVPSNESPLPLSSQRRLVTAPLSTTSFRTLKFRVLIMWQI